VEAVKLVWIEGKGINPDQVCFVRPAEENERGFRTIVVSSSGMQHLETSPEQVGRLLENGFADREATTQP
jgi:hypothetical protein